MLRKDGMSVFLYGHHIFSSGALSSAKGNRRCFLSQVERKEWFANYLAWIIMERHGTQQLGIYAVWNDYWNYGLPDNPKESWTNRKFDL